MRGGRQWQGLGEHHVAVPTLSLPERRYARVVLKLMKELAKCWIGT